MLTTKMVCVDGGNGWSGIDRRVNDTSRYRVCAGSSVADTAGEERKESLDEYG